MAGNAWVAVAFLSSMAVVPPSFGQSDPARTRKWPIDGSCYAEIMDRPLPTPAGVVIAPRLNRAIEYYEVRAESFLDFERAMRANARGGAMGWTFAEVAFEFKSHQKAQECRVTDVRATCNATIHLPKWVNPEKAAARVRDWFAESSRNLAQHEEGHVKICSELARDVERAVWATPPGTDCVLVDLNARNRGQRVIMNMNYLQMKYDKCEYDTSPRWSWK